MNDRHRQRAVRWACVGAWVTAIYSTLYIVRPVCEYLKANTPFNLIVNVFSFAVFALILSISLAKIKIRRISTLCLLVMLFIIYTAGFLALKIPEERIHLFEYGFLAFLIVWALSLDYPKTLTYCLAFVLTSLLGWVDEGIQYLLPNRYYQFKDVALNAASGALGLMVTYTLNRDRK